MVRFETDFQVLKNEAGEANGFSLIAQPQTEAEVFCSTLPKALVDGSADIKFEVDEIVFDHSNCNFSGRLAHKLEAADIAPLRELLNSKRKLKLERAGFLTPGFKIVCSVIGLILLLTQISCAVFNTDKDCHIYALEQQQRVPGSKILCAEGVNYDGEFWGHCWMVFESKGATYAVDRNGSWKYGGNQKDPSAFNIASWFAYPRFVKMAEWR